MRHFADPKSGTGERIHRRVIVKVFDAAGTMTAHRILRAKPGHGIGAEGIEGILFQVADELEAKYPDDDFRLVPIGEAQFNFVWRGKRGKAASA